MTRTLSALLAVAFVTAIWLPTVATSAPEGGWSGFDAVTDRAASNVPTWTPAIAADFPACHAPRESDGMSDRVVVRTDGTTARVSIDDVFAAAENDADGFDLWVVGTC